MKPLERIPILANVLIVACERPATEVGKLVKAVVAYATKGVKPPMDDIRLETYFGLIAQDLDAQRMQGSSASRSYLFVYLRDRQWEYVERYEQPNTEI